MISQKDRHTVCQNYEKLEQMRRIYRTLEIIDNEEVLKAFECINPSLDRYESAMFHHIRKKKTRPAIRN